MCGVCYLVALPPLTPGWVIDSFIARLCFVMIMAHDLPHDVSDEILFQVRGQLSREHV